MKPFLVKYFYILFVIGGVYSTQSTAGVPSPSICAGCEAGDCSCGCGTDGHNFSSYAPISVMGDHLHHKGGLMASYRYMFMRMAGNYDGDSRISSAAAKSGYMMAATDMDMQMHMLSLMYAPSNKITLMLMSNYSDKEMGMENLSGVKSRMNSSGWGDVTLAAYYSLYKKSSSSAHFGLGISAPTGSINETLANSAHQPFPMQLGSGSWEIQPSITWLKQVKAWSYGGQVSAVIHLDKNDNGYKLGDIASLTGWVSHRLNAWSAVSLRLTGRSWGNVNGRDSQMPTIPMGPLMGQPVSGSADPDSQGGSRIDLALGLSIWNSEANTRLALEAGTPIYQNLDGSQLGAEWFLTAGIQFTW